jgi:hypothetical protein
MQNEGKMSEVLRAAGAALERKERIEAVIRSGVAELQDLILTRLQAERDFRRLECQAAIGELAPAAPALEKAKKAAEGVRAALAEVSMRLGGFRQQLGDMGGSFVRAYDQLEGELPRHNARLAESFASEWQESLSVWQNLLGRRAAVEALVGPLSLPDPVAAPVDIGEAAAPGQILTRLAAAIKNIASVKAIAERPLQSTIFYDRSATYKIVTDRMADRLGIRKGSLVMDASFDAGRLAQLLELGDARPVLDRDLAEGVTLAASKADEILKAARKKEEADSERRLHASSDENQKRSGRMVGPEYEGYTLTPADLARIAEKNAQIAGRSIGASDPEYSGH